MTIRLRFLMRGDLIVNPATRFLHAVPKSDVRFPTEILENKRIIRNAAVDAFGGLEVVGAFEFHSCNVFDDID
jgi:hypothetical protein